VLRTSEEEMVNAYSHLLSSIFSLCAMIIFIIKAPNCIAQLQILTLGGSATFAFFASFLYHGSKKEKNRERNRILDRSAIYSMIAGSGIAISLTNHDHQTAALYCSSIILISSYLIVSYCLKRTESEVQAVVSYVLLGWFCLMPGTGIIGKTLMTETSGLIWLIVGGVLYSIGVVFYINDNKKWFHTAWHAFVMLGYCAHLFAHVAANGIY